MAASNHYPTDVDLIELAKTTGSLQQTAAQIGVSRVSLTNYLLRRPQLDKAVRSVIRSRASVVALAAPSQKVRDKSAKKGTALPDGSYPINNVRDLKNAISAYGRAKPEHRAAVRRLIKRRARELKVPNLIPDSWRTSSVSLAADHKSSTHPDPPNKPGMNWIERIGGHLPPFIKRVAKHIMADSGYPQSRAIAAAISQCKRGRLGPKGLAAAAQWEALKARAHAHSNAAYDACMVIELATYSAQQLGSYYNQTGTKAKAKPAKGAGGPAAPGGKKKVVRTDAGAKRYKVPIGSEIGQARDKNAAAAQQNVAAKANYDKTVGAADRDKQIGGLNPKDLGDLSRVAFSFKSSDPNVVALRMSVVRELSKRGMDPKQFGYLGGGASKPTAKKPAVAKAPARKPTSKKPAPAPKPVDPRKHNFGRVRVQ